MLVGWPSPMLHTPSMCTAVPVHSAQAQSTVLPALHDAYALYTKHMLVHYARHLAGTSCQQQKRACCDHTCKVARSTDSMPLNCLLTQSWWRKHNSWSQRHNRCGPQQSSHISTWHPPRLLSSSPAHRIVQTSFRPGPLLGRTPGTLQHLDGSFLTASSQLQHHLHHTSTTTLVMYISHTCLRASSRAAVALCLDTATTHGSGLRHTACPTQK